MGQLRRESEEMERRDVARARRDACGVDEVIESSSSQTRICYNRRVRLRFQTLLLPVSEWSAASSSGWRMPL